MRVTSGKRLEDNARETEIKDTGGAETNSGLLVVSLRSVGMITLLSQSSSPPAPSPKRKFVHRAELEGADCRHCSHRGHNGSRCPEAQLAAYQAWIQSVVVERRKRT